MPKRLARHLVRSQFNPFWTRRLPVQNCLLVKSAVRWLVVVPILVQYGYPRAIHGQVVPDQTLPNGSVVNRAGDVIQITEGTTAGPNLFHSFQEFSVPIGTTASFQDVSPEIATIISRITGRSRSRIDGMIEALDVEGAVSGADVFLLNPNGILFGPDASLNIGGSFIATTAEQIDFADGTAFGIDDNSQSAPLLTISTPVGIQFGNNPGIIRNESINDVVLDDFDVPIQGGLQVGAGKTIALLGGSVQIPGGVVLAEGGWIELGGVGSNQTVRLRNRGDRWIANYRDTDAFQNVEFTQAASVVASGDGGGGIQIRGNRVTISQNSFVVAETFGANDGAGITIRATDIAVQTTGLISTFTSGAGDGGDVRLEGDRILFESGGEIVTGTENFGNGGNVILLASKSIDMNGFGSCDATANCIFTGVFVENFGPPDTIAGSVMMTAPKIQVRNGAQVSTPTFGPGAAGSITVQSERLEVRDVARLPNRQPLVNDLNQTFPSGLFTDTSRNSTGDGADLTITTNQLIVQDGAVVQTNTEGSGAAGDLTVIALEFVEVAGVPEPDLLPSVIFSASGGIPGVGGFSEATGRGGELVIRTPELRVLDEGAIAVGGLNSDVEVDGGGTITIEAQNVLLDNQGRILAETASGNGGNISLLLGNALVLRRGSSISTTAGTERAGGDGGNVTIETPILAAVPAENSDITANAFTGQGGDILITTQSLFGIDPQSEQTPVSDITASSELGVSGTIIIDSPDVDPSETTVGLPSNLVDASQLIAQGCNPSGAFAQQLQGEFVAIGRGGVMPSPTGPLSSHNPVDDLQLPSSWTMAAAENTVGPLREAQGWIKSPTGSITFVAALLPRSLDDGC